MFSPRPLALAAALFALVSVSSAQTGVPVVSQIGDIETYIDVNYGSNRIHNVPLTAINSPSQFHVTGLPPHVSLVDSGPEAGLSWYDTDLTGGKFTVTVTADNAAGTSAPMTFHWTIQPARIGYVLPDKNVYHVGDTVTLTAQYTAPVVVSAPPDAPYIYLWNGKKAEYASGSGTPTLTFTYGVSADDTSASNYTPGSPNAPRPITTLDGVAIGTYSVIPTSSSPPVIGVVGTEPDTITKVSGTAGTYNGAITFTVAFTHNVTITGTPVMHLTVDGVARTAAFTSFQPGPGYVGVSQPCLVSFQYIPSPGDKGSVVLQSPIDLNGGTITSLNGTPAVLAFDPSTVTGVNVDTASVFSPVITGYDATSATPSFRGQAAPGAAVSVSAGGRATQEAIAASDGTWQTSWTGDPLPAGSYSFGAYTDANGRFIDGSNYVTVTIPPTSVPVVQPIADQEMAWQFYRHDEPDEIHVTATNAPTRFDATGVPPEIAFFSETYYVTYGVFRWTYGGLGGGKYNVSVTATNAVGTSAPVSFHWIIHPGMTYFLTTDKRQYVGGDLITFTAHYSAPVEVTGTPFIQLWGTKKALYAGGSGTATLTFTYRVAADDPAASGLYYDTITAGDGSIQTRDGVSAELKDSYQGLGDYPTFSVIQANQSVPVVSNATVAGQVGTPIAVVQLQATNSPTSFAADATLGNYGLQLSSSGVISGTPTRAASDVAISFTASNASGQSAPGTLTLNIAPTPPSSTKSDPTITFASPTSAVRVGQPITLGAISSANLPITYSVVSGDATLAGNVLTPLSGATLIVRAATAATDTYNAASTDVNFGNPIPVGNSRLVNISSRVRVSAGDADGATIAGFYVTGTTPKQILIRAVGPSLTQFGITNPVSAPQLTLYNDKNAVIATDAGWNDDASIASAGRSVGAFDLNAGSSDSALLMTLAPGLYTAQVQGGNTGTALVEVYDVGSADPNPTKQLINISTRGYVGTDQDVLVGGFVVSGDAPKRILIRGIGPGLTQFGVTGVVSDPVLKVYDAKQAVVAQNDNWETPQPVGASDTPATAAQITAADTTAGAFPLAAGSTDAAMIVTLNPGQYTAIVSGANGGTGNAIVEVYEVP